MKFTRNYRGPLFAASKSNNRKQHKHELRQHFHKQLKELSEQVPLRYYWLSQILRDHPYDEHRKHIRRSLGSFEFIPIVHARLYLTADLKITLLRPEPPGNVLTQSGDLDNRLKTLLDALKLPDSQQLPQGASPTSGESPFICLLSDASLVTGFDITTARLLDPNPSLEPNEVLLLIDVHIKALMAMHPEWTPNNTAFLGA